MIDLTRSQRFHYQSLREHLVCLINFIMKRGVSVRIFEYRFLEMFIESSPPRNKCLMAAALKTYRYVTTLKPTFHTIAMMIENVEV